MVAALTPQPTVYCLSCLQLTPPAAILSLLPPICISSPRTVILKTLTSEKGGSTCLLRPFLGQPWELRLIYEVERLW